MFSIIRTEVVVDDFKSTVEMRLQIGLNATGQVLMFPLVFDVPGAFQRLFFVRPSHSNDTRAYTSQQAL